MNTGLIASRYAEALLKFTTETGRSEQVCAQIVRMLKNPDDVPPALEPDLGKFIALLVKHGRMEYLRFIFHTYVRRYYASAGIKLAHLTSAVSSAGLEERVKKTLEECTGCKVLMESDVNPELLGGFVLEMDDKMLDASARHQIELIRKQLIVKNNRLV